MIYNFLSKKLENLYFKHKPNFFFMHIPKTGGTSIDSAFEKIYRLSYSRLKEAASQKTVELLRNKSAQNQSIDFLETMRFRRSLLVYEMFRNTHFISGHTYFDTEVWNRFGHKYAYITVLREPVKRYISYYFFNLEKPDKAHGKINQSLTDFLKSEKGRRAGKVYARYLCGNLERISANDFPNHDDIAKAKENLKKFKAVGFLENIEAFKQTIEKDFSLNIKIPYKNKNVAKNINISPEITDQIRRNCQIDLEIYNYAKNIFLSLRGEG